MDKSETYIKMCDCPQVQSGRKKLRRGDWFAQKILTDSPPGVYLFTDDCAYCNVYNLLAV